MSPWASECSEAGDRRRRGSPHRRRHRQRRRLAGPIRADEPVALGRADLGAAGRCASRPSRSAAHPGRLQPGRYPEDDQDDDLQEELDQADSTAGRVHKRIEEALDRPVRLRRHRACALRRRPPHTARVGRRTAQREEPLAGAPDGRAERRSERRGRRQGPTRGRPESQGLRGSNDSCGGTAGNRDRLGRRLEPGRPSLTPVSGRLARERRLARGPRLAWLAGRLVGRPSSGGRPGSRA